MHIDFDYICADSLNSQSCPYAQGKITVDHYDHVYTGCTISNGQIVPGTPATCSSWIHGGAGCSQSEGGTGTVVGCPN